MVDLTKLSQEQKWGLSYATKLANESIESSNATKPVEEQSPLLSESDYAEQILRGACESYYVALLDAKKKTAIEKFESLPPQQQAALLAQLQVPDVLPP